MYLLWYSVDEKKYNLEFIGEANDFTKSNELDVIYEFEENESAVATKVLKNLNLALRNVA